MPVGKKRQNNTVLNTLITFVALFIVAAVIAVIFYVKSEEHKTNAADLQSKMDEMATKSELRKIGTIVGAKDRKKSRLGTMVEYLDRTTTLILGSQPEDTSAEVKIDAINKKVKEALASLAKEELADKGIKLETVGLVPITEKLTAKLNDTKQSELAIKAQHKQLQDKFDDAMAAGFEKEQALLAEKEKYQQQFKTIEENYSELKIMMEQTSEQQVQTLMTQLEEERTNRNKTNKELLKTQAELKIAQNRMRRSQEKLQTLVPPPDSEVAAYKHDGKVILIDRGSKTVHLNIGSRDHVYRGLTFSVYDKSAPIPKNGKGKAEIEVFDIGKNISIARIIKSDVRRPVILDDIIANLIWDSTKMNVFVVSGRFDLDGDSYSDYNAVEKITALIEKWGGRVSDDVSIDTDFLVLGLPPKTIKKPTFEQMEVDPMAMEKYERSLQKLERHKEAKKQAEILSIPVFNTERFLYFVGYKKQSGSAGAF